MKYCEDYAALISAWLDGELNEEETGRLQAHLFTCPGCRAYLADLKAMGRAFPSLEEVEVPEDFTASVMARIRAQTPPEKKRASHTLWRRWGAWACCLALLVLVGGGVWRAGLVSRSIQNQIAAADMASISTEEVTGEESDCSQSAQAAPEDTAPAEESIQEDTVRSDSVFESKEAQSRNSGETSASQEEKTPVGETQSPVTNGHTAPGTSEGSQKEETETEAPKSDGMEVPTSPDEETAAQNGVLSWRVSVTVPAAGADLLTGFTPRETDGETGGAVYYLSSEEYEALVTALSDRGIGAEETAGDAAASLIRVVVTP